MATDVPNRDGRNILHAQPFPHLRCFTLSFYKQDMKCNIVSLTFLNKSGENTNMQLSQGNSPDPEHLLFSRYCAQHQREWSWTGLSPYPAEAKQGSVPTWRSWTELSPHPGEAEQGSLPTWRSLHVKHVMEHLRVNKRAVEGQRYLTAPGERQQSMKKRHWL